MEIGETVEIERGKIGGGGMNSAASWRSGRCDVRQRQKRIGSLKMVVKQLEDGGQATIDELVEINLHTKEEPRPVTCVHQLIERDC